MKKIRSNPIRFGDLGLKACVFAAALLGIAFALNGCNKSDNTQTPGQKLDSAIGKTQEAASDVRLQGEKSGADIKAKTEAAFSVAGETLKNSAEKAESSAKIVANKTINKIDDMAITTAISAELLKDAEIKLFQINVDTKGGAVVLKGNVSTNDVRDRAGAIAKTFSGVQSVDNQLAIKVN